MYGGCDGSFVPDYLVDFHDAIQRAHRSHAYLDDFETRRRLYYEDRERERVDAVVRALLVLAERTGPIEHAAVPATPERRDDEAEAERILVGHGGFFEYRLEAFRGLARSRGIPLERILRAALGGELRAIVELPPGRQRTDG